MILCISVVSVVTSPFSFLTLLIWNLFPHFFFLMTLVNNFSICLSSQRSSFWFHWSLLSFSLFPFIYVSLIFMILFLLLTLGFLLLLLFLFFLFFFPVYVNRGCLFEVSLIGEVGLYCCKIPSSVQFSSVAQSCPTLCDPNDCSMPGLPVHHQLLEFTQTHVPWVSDAIQPSHPLSSTSPPAFNFFKWVSSSH